MRESKFRAYITPPTIKKEMLEWDKWRHEICAWLKEPENFPNIAIMQFTGLLDKNRKEIYEGDVVSGYPTWGQQRKKKSEVHNVFFADGNFMCDRYALSLVREIEIIGNIYENPELLNPPIKK